MTEKPSSPGGASRPGRISNNAGDCAEQLNQLFELLSPLGNGVRAAKGSIEALTRFSTTGVLPSPESGSGRTGLSSTLPGEVASLVAELRAAHAVVASAVEGLHVATGPDLWKTAQLNSARQTPGVISKSDDPSAQLEARLEPIAQRCAEIAHEINNCLQVIMTELQKLDSIDSAPPALIEVRTNTRALGTLLRRAAEVCHRAVPLANATLIARSSKTWRGDASRAHEKPDSIGGAPPGNPVARRVLIVDDFPAILRAIERSLRASDFDCSCATSAEEALSLLTSENAPQMDVVVTDVGLPKISGIQLAELVRAKFPKLPIVLLSGDTSMIPSLDHFRGSIAVLAKPFRPRALIDLVQSMIQ